MRSYYIGNLFDVKTMQCSGKPVIHAGRTVAGTDKSARIPALGRTDRHEGKAVAMAGGKEYEPLAVAWRHPAHSWLWIYRFGGRPVVFRNMVENDDGLS